MAIKPKFYAKVKNGWIDISDKERIEAEKYLVKFEGQEVEMVFSRKRKARTQGLPGEETNFNGYYWAVIIRIVSDTMGEIDDEYTHNLLQMIFNKEGKTVMDPQTKKMINVEVVKGTKDMSGAEFAEYCSKIRMWAAIPGNLCEKGCYIPSPHEASYE